MHPAVDDTDPKAREFQLNLIRRMTPDERLARVLQLNHLLGAFAEAGIRARHPNAGDREVFLRVAAQRLPRESMIRVYGWDPHA